MKEFRDPENPHIAIAMIGGLSKSEIKAFRRKIRLDQVNFNVYRDRKINDIKIVYIFHIIAVERRSRRRIFDVNCDKHWNV